MIKIRNKKRLIIIICILKITIIVVGFGVVSYIKASSKNKLLDSANKLMTQEKYSEAEAILREALKYGNDPNIQSMIMLSMDKERTKEIYDSGLGKMNGQKYDAAISCFSQTLKYKDSKFKIDECKKLKHEENIKEKEDAKRRLVFQAEQEKKLAIRMVKDRLNITDIPSSANPNKLYLHVDCDHMENGKYIIHVYEIVPEDPATGFPGHTATMGWYAVDPKVGSVTNMMDM